MHIFYEAVAKGRFKSCIAADTALPMMYMPDCLESMIRLMEYRGEGLRRKTDFNVTAFSFTPKQLAQVIQKYIPHFEIEYRPDFRQKIAESWPDDMDDSEARSQWGWKPRYTLEAMAKEIIETLRRRLRKTGSVYPSRAKTGKL